MRESIVATDADDPTYPNVGYTIVEKLFIFGITPANFLATIVVLVF